MINTLDIEPTTICNLNCPFCFGPIVNREETEIDLQLWKDAFFKFRNMGVENVVISGGEPLIYHRIFELIYYLKDLNYNIVLSTNGRYKEKLFEIAPYCDWISLPIDGISSNVNRFMRTDNYPFSEILSTALELKKKHSKLSIKIGSVVTQHNYQEIINIGDVLKENLNCFDVWKIYQYTPRRKQINNYNSLYISDMLFSDLSIQIRNRLASVMKIVFSSNQSRRNAYAFIYQSGDANIANVGDNYGDVYVGNISCFDNINFQLVNKLLNNNHYSNYTNTY